MLSKLKEENKVVGTKQARRALLKDEAKFVFIAKDAEPHVVKDVIELCNQKGVEIIYVNTMKELGEACDIDVSAATAVILK